MITACISESLLDFSSHDSLNSLCEALINSLTDLQPTDYVCFNIGNASLLFGADNQSKMIQWERALQLGIGVDRNGRERESGKLLELIAEDNQDGNNNAGNLFGK